MDITKNPPSWQLDAVPSQYGWHHPVTNELLVSVPGGVQIEEKIEQPVTVPVPELVIQKLEEAEKIQAAVTKENVESATKEGLVSKLTKAVKRGRNSK